MMSFSLLSRRLSLYSTNRTKRRMTWRSYALLVVPATCFGLGYWQVKRRRWKLDLIERLDNQLKSPPVPLPSTAKASTDLSEYSPVTVRGRFDHSRELLIGPRPLIADFVQPGGYGSEWCLSQLPRTRVSPYNNTAASPSPFGYFVVTPFYLADRPGTSILVNRGWVPEGKRDPATRPKGQIKGTVELSGFIRYPEKPPMLAPKPLLIPCQNSEGQAPQMEFGCRQIDVMAEIFETLPLFIDAKYDIGFQAKCSQIPTGNVYNFAGNANSCPDC